MTSLEKKDRHREDEKRDKRVSFCVIEKRRDSSSDRESSDKDSRYVLFGNSRKRSSRSRHKNRHHHRRSRHRRR